MERGLRHDDFNHLQRVETRVGVGVGVGVGRTVC